MTLNAKVIFGTVRDDKLKKNEVKITVIAAGFPENNNSHDAQNANRGMTFQGGAIEKETAESVSARESRDSRDDRKNRDGSDSRDGHEEKKSRIFGGFGPQESAPSAKENKNLKEEKKVLVEDDDDWGAIRHF